MPSEILNFYRFQRVDADLAADFFFNPAKRVGLLGTILTADEGWNVTLAGTATGLDAYLFEISEQALSPSHREIKRMRLNDPPFRKLMRKVKPEIVTFRQQIDFTLGKDTFLSAAEFHDLLQANKDIVLLDVRNKYEKAAGTFVGAIDLGIESFSELPDAVANAGIGKDKTVVTFCTGGIRCEKAVPYLKELGYSALQIDGGIWRYIENYPDGFFEGKCFWFDHRAEGLEGEG